MGTNFLSYMYGYKFHCLFAKMHWPGDSKGTFWFSSQVTTCVSSTQDRGINTNYVLPATQ